MKVAEGKIASDAQSGRAGLTRLFNDTRKRLVETGTRNRLVHVNRSNARGNVLNIVNERSDDVHRILSEHQAMRSLALGRDRDDDAGSIRLADEGDQQFDEGRYTDAQLETRLGPADDDFGIYSTNEERAACGLERVTRRLISRSRIANFGVGRLFCICTGMA